MNRTSSLILILLAIGIFYTFTMPQYGDAQALAAEADQYRNVITNVSKITETEDQLRTSYQSIPQAEKDRLAKVLPDAVDAVALAHELDAIGAQYGITLKSAQVEDEVAANAQSKIVLPESALPYGKEYVTFAFVSDYPSFVRFLADVERSLRVMDVTSASFQVGQQNAAQPASNTNLYEHKLTVETYWLK